MNPIGEPHGYELQRCWKRRLDLRFQQADDARWNVLDPVTRQSYRVGLAEHWLLTRPDGRQPLSQLLQRFRRDLPGVAASDQQLLSCIAGFGHAGLLSSPGVPAVAGSPSKGWQEWLGSSVVWQIRGVNPDRWLAKLAPHTNALFTIEAVRFWVCLAILALSAVMLDFQRLASQSLSLDWILHPTTAGSLLVVFIATRALHELGHALVCKRFGIRCPDIGLFVILGAPCVYCDVSESWQLPSRWQRAAVAAAGMYVEFIAATLAAALWLATHSGPANTLALQTMLVCSISTLVINANPLMRFDGYYILADWLDEVNLRGKADSLAMVHLKSLILGVHASEPPRFSVTAMSVAKRRMLMGFSLAGWLYRAMLSLTIASLLVAMYTHWNLPWVGRFLAAAILISWWGVPMVHLGGELWRAAGAHARRWRMVGLASLAILIIAGLPIPNRQSARGWLQPQRSQGVYAGADAQLVSCSVKDGQLVEAGQALFQLRSPPLNARLIRYQQARRVNEIRLEASTRMRDMHSQDVDLQQDTHQLSAATSRLVSLQREIASLELSASDAGRLIAMPVPSADRDSGAGLGLAAGPVRSAGAEFASTGSFSSGSLDGASTTHWCEPQQVGRYMSAGTLLACVCSSQSIAVIPLNEQQLSHVAVGTPVRLRLPHARRQLVSGSVRSVVQIDQLASPWQAAAMSAISQVAVTDHAHQHARFAAVIELPDDVAGIPGGTVDAVFISEAVTLFGIAQRWLASNLRLIAD